MKKLLQAAIFSATAISFNSSALADAQAGMATGYPPYQFLYQGELTGFDVAVANAIYDKLGERLTLNQYDWDNVVSLLRYGELDIAIGMEKTDVRQQYFSFSTPYYERQTALFILASNKTAENVRQLVGKRISGDRHSVLEAHLRNLGLRDAIRVEQADSKKDAMAQLAVGEVEAVIMPRRVANYLAAQYGVQLKVLWQPNDATPVAMAVARGNDQLLQKLNQAITLLERDGTLERLRKQWDITPIR
jgi:ABC-type amino acid transport substrate-binding protein